MEEENSNKTELEDNSQFVRINYIIPPNVDTSFADFLFVQHKESHFILSFWETIEPLKVAINKEEIKDLPEDIKLELSRIKSPIERRCVSRIVVTPAMLKSILDAISTNWGRYVEKYGEGK